MIDSSKSMSAYVRYLIAVGMLAGWQAVAWAEEMPVPAIRRMDGATRARVLAALAGLIILGFGMVLLIWLGARITHRYRHGTSYFRPTPRPGENDWAAKPLNDPPHES